MKPTERHLLLALARYIMHEGGGKQVWMDLHAAVDAVEEENDQAEKLEKGREIEEK